MTEKYDAIFSALVAFVCMSRKYANNSHFSKYFSTHSNGICVYMTVFFFSSLSFLHLLGIWFCWCNCHCDLWRCQKINHLNLTSLHILQTNHLLHASFFFVLVHLFIYPKVVLQTAIFNGLLLVCVKSLQTNRNKANEAIEREEERKLS